MCKYILILFKVFSFFEYMFHDKRALNNTFLKYTVFILKYLSYKSWGCAQILYLDAQAPLLSI